MVPDFASQRSCRKILSLSVFPPQGALQIQTTLAQVPAFSLSTALRCLSVRFDDLVWMHPRCRFIRVYSAFTSFERKCKMA